MAFQASEDTKLGVALSGGGLRATLFDLGALMYLVDAERAGSTVSISSVSGGSYVNAYAGLFDYPNTTREKFTTEVVLPIFTAVTSETIWTDRKMWAEMGMLGLPLLAMLNTRGGLIGKLTRVAGVAGTGILLGHRGQVMADTVIRKLFPDLAKRKLSELPSETIDHVFGATSLHDGKMVNFTPRFLHSRWLGWSDTGDDVPEEFDFREHLLLTDVLHASAAIPVIFPPKYLPTKYFERGDHHDFPDEMALIDGGLYNNLAEQWLLDAVEGGQADGDRARRSPTIAQQFQKKGVQSPNTLLIVNARRELRPRKHVPFTNASFVPFSEPHLPLMRDPAGIIRSARIMSYNATERRLQALRRRIKASSEQGDLELGGKQLKGGSVVGIDRTPFAVPRSVLARSEDGATEFRVKKVLSKLYRAGEPWDEIAQRNRKVSSMPHRFDRDLAVDLMYHSYMATWANLCSLFDGFWMLDTARPNRAWFKDRWGL